MISIDEGQWKRLCRKIGSDWRYTPEDVVIDTVIEDLTAYGKLLRKEATRNRRKAINKAKIVLPEEAT